MHGFQRSTFDREHQEEEAEAERVRLVQAEAARRRQNQPRDPQGPIDWRGIAKHLAQNREHQEEEEEAERVRIYTFMQCAPKFLCVFVVDRPPNTAGVLSCEFRPDQLQRHQVNGRWGKFSSHPLG